MLKEYDHKYDTDKVFDEYRYNCIAAIKKMIPSLYHEEILEAVNYVIGTEYKEVDLILSNSYEKTEQKSNVYKLVSYIMEREPVLCSSGVLFKRRGSHLDMFISLIDEFIDGRKFHKGEMFKYPVGSEMYEKENLQQLNLKVCANASFGAACYCKSIFYNFYSALSILSEARTVIAWAILLFEQVMNNNVKFCCFDEMVKYIVDICEEERFLSDDVILASDVDVDECLFKVLSTCGFYYIPTNKEAGVIKDMLDNVSQTDLNRIFYKGNLFSLIEYNPYVMNLIDTALTKLKSPFLDPNHTPEEIKDEQDLLYKIIKEYVYYKQLPDARDERVEIGGRSVSVLTDTDSCFISFDGWFRFILSKVCNNHYDIMNIELLEGGTLKESDALAPKGDLFDFYDNDEEMQEEYEEDEVEILNASEEEAPFMVAVRPRMGLRCSIINLLADVMTRISLDHLQFYCDRIGSSKWHDGSAKKTLLILKNELGIRRALIPETKRNYALNIERQESKIIPKHKALKIAGLPIMKTGGVPEITQKRLKSILFDHVLDTEDFSQVEIVRQLATIEKNIYDALVAGDTTYFKNIAVKPISLYENPMSEYRIKSCLAYNAIKQPYDPEINVENRNMIYIINVDTSKKNMEALYKTFPEVHNRIVELQKDPAFKSGVNKIAITEDMLVTDWIKEIIDFKSIINDNISTFPCEAIGISRKDKNFNYTNIVKVL